MKTSELYPQEITLIERSNHISYPLGGEESKEKIFGNKGESLVPQLITLINSYFRPYS
jgi:hypothetical protein